MARKLSVKIVSILIMVMVVIMTLFTIYFVRTRSARMEEELLTKGRIATFTEEELFDQNDVPIPHTDPPKYHTRFDSYLDANIQDIEDEYLKDEQVVYAILVDRNGYLPTHHRQNSQPLTGDPEKDRVGNRTKRIFNKEVELTAARNREPFLKQVFLRDTGEKMWDLSAPVLVNGKHWGAVRIGFSMEKTDKKITALRFQIIGAMLIMLLITSLTIYLVVSRSVRPLLRLTEAARRIADGNLDEEV